MAISLPSWFGPIPAPVAGPRPTTTLDEIEAGRGAGALGADVLVLGSGVGDSVASGAANPLATLDAMERDQVAGQGDAIPTDALPVLIGSAIARRAPAASDPAATSYTVQDGDTFRSVAHRVLGDENRWQEIWALNRAAVPNPNLLFPGLTLALPGAQPSAPGPATPAPAPARPPASAGSGPMLQIGETGPAVKSLQSRLKALGFDPGAIDGELGPQTVAALKRFQIRNQITADGVSGPDTWQALGIRVSETARTPNRPSAGNEASRQSRLRAALNNPYRGVVHQCFRYAWTTVGRAGGRGIDSAPSTHAGRGASIGYLASMIGSGELRVGDVIYVNRKPGADPSSTNLAYGPHWFVYLGNDTFGDQYGTRGVAAMQAFVPGRRIDTIYHTMS